MKRNKTIHSSIYTALISELVQERKRLGLSQTEVARLLKMRQSEISKIENFERRLDILELKELLNVYHLQSNMRLKKIITQFLGLG